VGVMDELFGLMFLVFIGWVVWVELKEDGWI
jgi:hypothetical protein